MQTGLQKWLILHNVLRIWHNLEGKYSSILPCWSILRAYSCTSSALPHWPALTLLEHSQVRMNPGLQKSQMENNSELDCDFLAHLECFRFARRWLSRGMITSITGHVYIAFPCLCSSTSSCAMPKRTSSRLKCSHKSVKVNRSSNLIDHSWDGLVWVCPNT